MSETADCGCEMPDTNDLQKRIKAALTSLVGNITAESVAKIAVREKAVWDLEREYFLTEEYARKLVEDSVAENSGSG